ncbi:MAG TPA: hypothetical protein VHS59_01480 [Bacillota bacterium]|nr:hypothetical protein [Bacillota bacterium]
MDAEKAKEALQMPVYSVNCPTCGNRVCDPEVLRCPRCFSPLFQGVACDGNCGKCRMKAEKCSSC